MEQDGKANLATKTDFDDKLKNRTKKINSNKTKHLIVENKFKKLETFDSLIQFIYVTKVILKMIVIKII